eukprot:1155679-Pelagomonas_calceolata.AAC.3
MSHAQEKARDKAKGAGAQTAGHALPSEPLVDWSLPPWVQPLLVVRIEKKGNKRHCKPGLATRMAGIGLQNCTCLQGCMVPDASSMKPLFFLILCMISTPRLGRCGNMLEYVIGVSGALVWIDEAKKASSLCATECAGAPALQDTHP